MEQEKSGPDLTQGVALAYYCVALRGNAPGWMKLIP